MRQHPRLGDDRVQLQRPLGSWEKLAEHLVAPRRHERLHDARRVGVAALFTHVILLQSIHGPIDDSQYVPCNQSDTPPGST
jgi:hypothetical protein